MTLAELEQRRAERQDPADLPSSMTWREVQDYAAATLVLDRRIRQARSALATLETLQDPDPTWTAFLTQARQTLCDELLQPVSPHNPKDVGRRQNLTLSIRVI